MSSIGPPLPELSTKMPPDRDWTCVIMSPDSCVRQSRERRIVIALVDVVRRGSHRAAGFRREFVAQFYDTIHPARIDFCIACKPARRMGDQVVAAFRDSR